MLIKSTDPSSLANLTAYPSDIKTQMAENVLKFRDHKSEVIAFGLSNNITQGAEI